MNTYDTDIQNLTCTCKDWQETRKDYSISDPRRLCKHIINKLDIINLPSSIKYFKESIEFYQEKEKGFTRDFEKVIDIKEANCKALYRDGDWINIFDENGNKYGLLINDNEYVWTTSGKPKNDKEIELFFTKEEYQPVIALTGKEIKEAEDILGNKYRIEYGSYVITTQERPYEISAKDINVEDYYDSMSTTNTTISITVQEKDYKIPRNQDTVQSEIKRLLEVKNPKIYPKKNDDDLMMKYDIDKDEVILDTKELVANIFKYEWERKLKLHYESAVVDKGLMLNFESFKLPRFVSEYVVSNFIELNGLQDGIVKVEEFLSTYCPKPNSTDLLHYKILTDGEINIIDNFKVNVHIEKHGSDHVLSIPSLNIKNAQVEDQNIILENPRLLGSGLWGMGKVTRRDSENRAVLSKFRSFQVSSIDLNLYKSKRKHFATYEWLNVLISTIGFNPEIFITLREKLIILSRLLPLIQKSTYLFEFGKPGTGKTYIFDKLSNSSFVISGSKITPAKLFRDCNTRQEGLLRQYESILFDEIDKINDSDFADEIVNKLLKFMESNSFDRCGEEMISDTSLIFSGNISRVQRDGMIPNFFEPLAPKLKGEAFLDRFSGVIPGWEIKPLSNVNGNFSTTQGFSADYFSAIMSELRLEEIEARVASMLEFSQNSTNRDEKAIIKNISGFFKLVFPDMQIDLDVAQKVVDYCVEIRQYVINERFELYGNADDKRQLEVRVVA